MGIYKLTTYHIVCDACGKTLFEEYPETILARAEADGKVCRIGAQISCGYICPQCMKLPDIGDFIRSGCPVYFYGHPYGGSG